MNSTLRRVFAALYFSLLVVSLGCTVMNPSSPTASIVKKCSGYFSGQDRKNLRGLGNADPFSDKFLELEAAAKKGSYLALDTEKIKYDDDPRVYVMKNYSGRRSANDLVHTVQQGDSLYGISQRYGLSVGSLRGFNPQIRGSSIFPGQSLIIKNLEGEADPIKLSSILDLEFADILCEFVQKRADGRRTRKLCLRGVRIALTEALKSLGHYDFSMPIRMGRSAHAFFVWAKKNPYELCRRYSLLAVVPADSEQNMIRRGILPVYPRGHCGFDGRYGHIEVIVSVGGSGSPSRRVCSDHCVYRSNSCPPEMYLVPVKGECEQFF